MVINKRLVGFLLVIIVLSIFSIYYPLIKTSLTGNSINSVNYEREQATLTRVIDGDTLELDSGEHVRLLGINTPEKNMPYSQFGKNFLLKFVNKTIELERDREDLDKYSRKLRYIYYEDRFLNLEIVEKGYANAYMLDGLKYSQDFLQAEEQARVLGLGIWTKSQEKCASCIFLSNLNARQETFTLMNNCSFSCNLSGWFVKDAGRNVIKMPSFSAQEEKTFTSNKSVWNDDSDKFFLFDETGKLVLYYSY